MDMNRDHPRTSNYNAPWDFAHINIPHHHSLDQQRTPVYLFQYSSSMEEAPIFFQSHSGVLPVDHIHAQEQREGNDTEQKNRQRHDQETEEEALGDMKEMIYRIAAMQPVDIDPATIKKPKRRNVRISDDPQSIAARRRREKISERIRILQRLVPGGTKMDTASMLDEAIRYVKFLKKQVNELQNNRHNSVGLPPLPFLAMDWTAAAAAAKQPVALDHQQLGPSSSSSSSSIRAHHHGLGFKFNCNIEGSGIDHLGRN